jgi:hypothetical protein
MKTICVARPISKASSVLRIFRYFTRPQSDHNLIPFHVVLKARMSSLQLALPAEVADVVARWELQRRSFVENEEHLLRETVTDYAMISLDRSDARRWPELLHSSTVTTPKSSLWRQHELESCVGPLQTCGSSLGDADDAEAAADRILACMAAEVESAGRSAPAVSGAGIQSLLQADSAWKATHATVRGVIGGRGTITRSRAPIVTAYKL